MENFVQIVYFGANTQPEDKVREKNPFKPRLWTTLGNF